MRALLALLTLALGMVAIAPALPVAGGAALAQGNTDERTPLNSRIPRSRPLPTEPRNVWQPRDLSDAQRARSRTMVDQLSRCLWNRSNEKGLDLLARTDFGFLSFDQIGVDDVAEIYPIETCMGRVARNANSSIMLRYDAPSMRSWYLQAAYFDMFEDEPGWIRPGYVVAEREYPLSSDNAAVRTAMIFADCVVAQDPHGADYFFRTAAGSETEIAALQEIVPAISACLPQGQSMEIDPNAMRQWLGEGLWHAANNSYPAPAESPEDTE